MALRGKKFLIWIKGILHLFYLLKLPPHESRLKAIIFVLIEQFYCYLIFFIFIDPLIDTTTLRHSSSQPSKDCIKPKNHVLLYERWLSSGFKSNSYESYFEISPVKKFILEMLFLDILQNIPLSLKNWLRKALNKLNVRTWHRWQLNYMNFQSINHI